MTGMQTLKAMSIATPHLMGVKMEKAVRLTGLRRRIEGLPAKVIPGFWDTFSPYRGWIPGQTGRASYGALMEAPGSTEGFDYLTAVEVEYFRDSEGDWDQILIPAQRYAVFSHRDHVSELRPALHTIFAHSLPGLNLVPKRHVDDVPLLLERYDENFDMRTGWGGIQVWVPLRD